MSPLAPRSGPDGLAELNRLVVRLAALAGESIQRATDALLDGDVRAAERVVVRDAELDALALGVESEAFRLLSRRPCDADLHRLAAVLRVVPELGRIGDNMVNVARAARRLFAQELDPRSRGLVQRMREQAALQLRVAVQAWSEENSSLGSALEDMDDVMDDLQKDLFRVVAALAPGDDNMQRAVHLALVGRYFERAADHAVNVGKRAGAQVPPSTARR